MSTANLTHPVYNDDKYSTETIQAQVDASEEEIEMWKKLYCMIDNQEIGYLGHVQFKYLLKLLDIIVTEEELDDLFLAMDENNDGQIEFDEMIIALKKIVTDDMLANAAAVRPGAVGTTRWKRSAIVWAANNGLLIACMAACTAALITFTFVLVPLITAYFLCFLVWPIISLLVHRPYEGCPKVTLCGNYPSEARQEKGDSLVGCLMDCTVFKIPHMMAVFASLFLILGLLGMLANLVYSEVTTLTADPAFIEELDAAFEEMMDSLNESGVEIVEEPPNRYCYWPRWCPADMENSNMTGDFGTQCREQTLLSVWDSHYNSRRPIGNQFFSNCGEGFLDASCEDGDDGFTVFTEGNGNQVKFDVAPEVPMTCTLTDGMNCEGATTDKEYPIQPTCMAPSDVDVIVGIIGAVANNVILVLLLWMFVISEATEKTMFNEESAVLSQIEVEVKFYITLKTAISLLTGLLVTICLGVFGVPLSTVFGLLAFVLNYIPNIGSMIAVVLPIPILIVWKPAADGSEDWKKWAALGSIAVVEGIVGNVVEPVLFGSALNMTALAVLGGLVMWGSIWGIMGAILSVPMLSIQKVVLINANHPYAKYALMMIRDDPLVDEKDVNIAGEDTVKEEE